MIQPRRDEEEIFHEALACEDAGRREAYLDEACGRESTLRRRVERLLELDEARPDFLEPPALAAEPTLPLVADQEELGRVVGRYTLEEKLGEGSFGVVYKAEQAEPVRRKVALKIIKVGMDSEEVIARFDAERQALARMDHPNLARVLDAGATETGRPYFVMDLVEGTRIDTYCDRVRLSTEGRLRLFLDVCSAVQHAHQKGVVHRDIKPSNVLVPIHNGRPVPKVIDFGVAKAVGSPLTDQPHRTGVRQMLGTPPYMSPEQADLGGVDVDARTDVYSLGVLLYQLLTAVPPFDAETFRGAGYERIQRIIRETEPPKPSTRLSTVGDPVEVARQRNEGTRELTRRLRGDLDRIVLKALEKDRRRRYATPHAMAADIQRHLDHEPVEARPPSLSHRLAKWSRRHKIGVSVAAAVVLVGAVALAVSTVVIWQAKQEAERALKQARAQHDVAEAQRTRAERNAREAQAVLGFLIDDMIGSGSPEVSRTQDVTVAQVVRRAERNLDDAFEGQPLVKASIHRALARATHELGQYGKALAHAKKAYRLRKKELGPRHPQTLAARRQWGHILGDQEKLEKSKAQLQATLRLQRKAGRVPTSETLYALGRTQKKRNRDARAEALLTRSLGRGGDRLTGADRFASINALADLLLHREREDVARWMLEQALPAAVEALGPNHPETLSTLHWLAHVASFQGDTRYAGRLFREAIERKVRVLGKDHPETILSMRYLALMHFHRGHAARARALDRRLLSKPPARLEAARTSKLRVARRFLAASSQDATLERIGARSVGPAFSCSWGPDGRRLVVWRVGDGGRLEIVDLDSGERRQLTEPGRDPAWSPKGTIAFVRGRHQLWLANPETGTTRQVGRGKQPTWSADGETLYAWSAKAGGIRAIDVAGGSEPRLVFETEDKFASTSPDGEVVAYEKEGKLVIRRVDGKLVGRWKRPHWNTVWGHWSPDSRYFAFSNGTRVSRGLWVFDRRTNRFKRLLRGPFGLPAWSKDGEKLAFVRRKETKGEAWVAETDSLERRKTYERPFEGRKVVIERAKKRAQEAASASEPPASIDEGQGEAAPLLAAAEAKGADEGLSLRAARHLLGLWPHQPVLDDIGARSIGRAHGCSWSPDGRRLVVWRTDEHGGLEIVDRSSGERRKLTAPGRDPAWSPAGPIAFVRGRNQIRVVDPATGAERQVARGKWPSWSADGGTLYYHAEERGEVRALELGSGEAPRTLLEVDGRFAAVAPDGEHVAYRKDGALVVRRLDGERVGKWELPGWGPMLVGRWSPDGRSFAFGNAATKNSVGLWVLDVGSERFKRVTHGPFGVPAWSKDGKRLAFVRRRYGKGRAWVVSTDILDSAETYERPFEGKDAILARARSLIPSGSDGETAKETVPSSSAP